MQDIYDKYYWQNDKVRIRAVHPEDDNYFEKLDSQAWAFASEEMTLPPVKRKIDESRTIEYEKNPGFSIENLNCDYIGDIRFNDINERHGTFEIGISIWRNFRNKGYGKAAMQIILDYAFNERRLNKFKAECIDCNIGSISLWKSLGCKLEGTIREEIFFNGTFHDRLIFGLTANEYKSRYTK